MAPKAKPRVPFTFEGVQNPWTPVAACNNCFVIPLYNCYSSSRSSVVIFKHYYDGLFIVKLADDQETIPSYPWLFRTQRLKSTNAGNDQGDVHR